MRGRRERVRGRGEVLRKEILRMKAFLSAVVPQRLGAVFITGLFATCYDSRWPYTPQCRLEHKREEEESQGRGRALPLPILALLGEAQNTVQSKVFIM